ncbi:MAG: hypothetical protein WC655_02165 [Candidatus Hydrogenedentales bacterium]|jgi:hypothetical protein
MTIHMPLVALELTRSGRKTSTYWLRTVPAILCLIVLMFAVPTQTQQDAGVAAEIAGSVLRRTLLIFQLAAALLAAPLFAAGAIARERQENTLNLLLLANCRAHDLVLAKVFAAFIQSELLILGCLPLQGIAAFLGGITIQASLYDLAVISSINLVMITSGVLASTVARRAADAYILVLGASLVCCAGLVVLLPGLSPFVDDSEKTWWLGVPFVMCCLAVAVATTLMSVTLLRRIQATPSKRKTRRSRKAWTLPWLPASLRLTPLARLYGATATEYGAGMLQGPGATIVMVVSILVALLPFGFVGLLATLIVAYDAATTLTMARRKGDLDLLFVTGADDRALARAIVHSQFKRALVFLPALAINTLATSVFAFFASGMEALAALEWGHVVLFALYATVATLDASTRLVLIVVIACSSAGSARNLAPPLATLAAALYYIVAGFFLGCLGGGMMGIGMDALSNLSDSTLDKSLFLLPLIVTSFFMAAFRCFVTLLIAYGLFRGFVSSIQNRLRPGLGGSL